MGPVGAARSRSRSPPANSRTTRAKMKGRHPFGSGNQFRFVVLKKRHAAVEPGREIVGYV